MLNGIVGAAGLRASLATLEAGATLALANKESMVAGGPFVLAAARAARRAHHPGRQRAQRHLPVPRGRPPRGGEDGRRRPGGAGRHAGRRGDGRRRPADDPLLAAEEILLTGSGGPFRGRSRDELAAVTRGRALQAPELVMGPKVTIDSATLMNKGLEVIEAHELFGVPYDAVRVVVHPQSIVHSLVRFSDGAVLAHLGVPDMRTPIGYALS